MAAAAMSDDDDNMAYGSRIYWIWDMGGGWMHHKIKLDMRRLLMI
jgi:hypothetical protein